MAPKPARIRHYQSKYTKKRDAESQLWPPLGHFWGLGASTGDSDDILRICPTCYEVPFECEMTQSQGPNHTSPSNAKPTMQIGDEPIAASVMNDSFNSSKRNVIFPMQRNQSINHLLHILMEFFVSCIFGC